MAKRFSCSYKVFFVGEIHMEVCCTSVIMETLFCIWTSPDVTGWVTWPVDVKLKRHIVFGRRKRCDKSKGNLPFYEHYGFCTQRKHLKITNALCHSFFELFFCGNCSGNAELGFELGNITVLSLHWWRWYNSCILFGLIEVGCNFFFFFLVTFWCLVSVWISSATKKNYNISLVQQLLDFIIRNLSDQGEWKVLDTSNYFFSKRW